MTMRKIMTLTAIYGLWILLVILWAMVAFQLQALMIYLGILVIQTPTLRPTGWNTSTLDGIYRCSFLLLGSLWLGMAVFIEKHLRERSAAQRLWPTALRLALIGGAIYGASAILLYLFS